MFHRGPSRQRHSRKGNLTTEAILTVATPILATPCASKIATVQTNAHTPVSQRTNN